MRILLLCYFIMSNIFAQEEPKYDFPVCPIQSMDFPLFRDCDENATSGQKKICFNKGVKQHIDTYFDKSILNHLDLEIGKYGALGQFRITEKGTISDIKIKAPHFMVAKELEFVISTLPKFKPAKERGKAVSVKYIVPFKFEVQKREKLMSEKQIIQFKKNFKKRRKEI